VNTLLPQVEELCKALIGYVRNSKLDPESAYSSMCVEAFRKNGIKVAYLFGSRVRATSRQDSDYDFAVLFGIEATVEDEVRLMLDLAVDLGVPVDRVNVVALDKADYELVYMVLREGKLVYASSEESRRMWERGALIKVLESGDIYEICMSRVKK